MRSVKATVVRWHCREIRTFRNIRWLIVEAPKAFPFDPAGAKYHHAFGWSPAALSTSPRKRCDALGRDLGRRRVVLLAGIDGDRP